MVDIRFRQYEFRRKKVNGKEQIFDECRKRWVSLTPEEWVRQNFLQYLMLEKRYPCSMIAVEREIMLGDLRKRFDVVIFKNAAPWMIVECKEMGVQLTDAVLQQILNYNISLQTQFLVITNGDSTFALKMADGDHQWLETLPDY